MIIYPVGVVSGNIYYTITGLVIRPILPYYSPASHNFIKQQQQELITRLISIKQTAVSTLFLTSFFILLFVEIVVKICKTDLHVIINISRLNIFSIVTADPPVV